MQRYLYLLFQSQSPIICCPLFSKDYLSPQAKINKIVNKHTVDYHPSPSQLVSRVHSLIFLWTLKGFISSESFFNFFMDLYIPLYLRKSFKFIVLRLLENIFVSQKIESVHFYSCPEAKFSPSFYHYPSGKRKLPLPPEKPFLKITFPEKKGGGRGGWGVGEDYGTEKNYQN